MLWVKYNFIIFEVFFDREFLFFLFFYKGKYEVNVVFLFEVSMELFQRFLFYSVYVYVVEAKVISYVREYLFIDCLINFINFLFKFKECLLKGDFVLIFCVFLINLMSFCFIFEDLGFENVIVYIRNVDKICFFIYNLWNNVDFEVILELLKVIFGLILVLEEIEFLICLGVVVRNILEEMIEIIVKYVINLDIDNVRMIIVL